MATLAEQYMSYYGEMEKEATVAQEIFAKTKREIPISARRGGSEIMAAGEPSVGGRIVDHLRSVGGKAGNAVQGSGARTQMKEVGEASGMNAVRHNVGKTMKDNAGKTGAGVYGAGALAAGAGALTLKKILSKKSVGERLVGAFKKNRGAVAAGAAGAAGLAGLAAFRKKDK